MENEPLEILELVIASPRSDSVDLEVLTLEEGQNFLHLYEGMAFEGYEKYTTGRDQWEVALQIILDNKLWMFARDDAGKQVFHKQEDYIRDLADRMKASRSTMFQRRAELKMATGGLGYSPEEVLNIGIKPFSVAKEFVTTDRDTGQITGFKCPVDTDGKEPQVLVREAIELVARASQDGTHDLDLRPRDMRKTIMEHLGVALPEIVFWAVPNARRGIDVGYTIEWPDGSFKKFTLADDEVPQEVQEKLFRGLHILSFS